MRSKNISTHENESFSAMHVEEKQIMLDSVRRNCPENSNHECTVSMATLKQSDVKEIEEAETLIISDPDIEKIKADDVSSSGYQSTCSSDITEEASIAPSNTSSCDRVSLKCFCQGVTDVHMTLKAVWAKHGNIFSRIVYMLVLLAYAVFLVFACLHDVNKAVPLLGFTGSFALVAMYKTLDNLLGSKVDEKLLQPIVNCINRKWYLIKWPVYVAVVAAIVTFLMVAVGTNYKQYTSLGGMIVFLLLLFVFSKHPGKVDLHPVLWGLLLQFIVAVLVLRTRWGFTFFHFIGMQVQTFLSYTDVGSKFVFGENYAEHMFAFKVLPVVIFFSSTVSVLYYLGVMQAIISKIAWLMQKTLQTSATESLVAAGNIFIGQSEAPILVRPFIQEMTKSEIHAVLTAGYATIAGSVLGAYILFGVAAEHLICASVMNAPVSLAVAKLFYPETETSKTKGKIIIMEKSQENNIIEAAAAGASQSLPLVANIAGNLIAFLAMLTFVNVVVSWLGGLVGHPEWSFELMCAYLFTPVAFLMGVQWEDCLLVGQLLGMKTFLNEFVAYEELSKLIKNRKACTGPFLSVRSEVIATYALCGFSNLSSVGVQIGGLGTLAPQRKSDIASVAVRALVAGTTVCFITACVASILTVPEPFNGCHDNRSSPANDSFELLDVFNNSQVTYTNTPL